METILRRVNDPSDLQNLDYQELRELAQEVRATIIRVITKTGGHLASNLGVVELTLALHRSFESPKDKIVWDTTNQCYTHKLVTGRREQFESIRKEAGLSGFGEPKESPHDTLCAGHAGTGLSIALGLAQAQRLSGENRFVIGVVGDGAMTSGLSYEALNNIAHLAPSNLIVVLNDNGWSISENVGFLTHWRRKVAASPEYQAFVTRGQRLADRMPGELAYKVVKRLESAQSALPTMIWEEIGFNYIGPVDGHNVRKLEAAFRRAKRSTGNRPVLVHVITHKGRGYKPAEEDPVRFHQPSSPLGSGAGAPTYSKVFADTASRLMAEDPAIVAISAAMLEGTGLSHTKKVFPDRVFDVGIAEAHAVTMAAGMAAGGFKPMVSVYSTFLQRAFDQIVHDVCLADLPVLFIVDRAGIVGEDGKTHHGSLDVSYLRCIPNMVLCAPKDENELQHLVYTAYKHGHPFAIRIPRGSGVGVVMDKELREMPIGKGEVLRDGTDVTMIALGKAIHPALEAADALAREGIQCMVVNPRFVKPMDETLVVHAARRTGRVLTVEENVLAGGFGSAVLETLSKARATDVTMVRLGMPDSFVEHATQAGQRGALGLDAEGIARRVREAFYTRAPVAQSPVVRGAVKVASV